MCKPPRYARHTPSCFVPLYALDPDNDEEPFRHHGTGTLVVYKGRPLLLTAAHVVEDARDRLAVFSTADFKVHRLRDEFSMSPIPVGQDRADDFLDVAAIALDPEFAAGVTFLSIGFYVLPEIPPNNLVAGVELMFAGYPATTAAGKSHAYHFSDGAQIVLRPQCVNTPLLPVLEYPAPLTADCLVSPFMNLSTREDDEWAEATFLPPGMSGGPVFAVQGDDVRLVGVATNWGNKEGYFVGTHLAPVAAVIEHAVATAH